MTDDKNCSIELKRRELRSRLRAARNALTEQQIAQKSQAIALQVLPLISNMKWVAGYLAMPSEVSVTQILSTCRATQQSTYVPVMMPENRMVFTPLNDHTTLVKNRFGILEPVIDPSRCIAAGDLHAVLVPLVGFDRHCHRMGMGGGYYDRAFAPDQYPAPAKHRPLLIGVAFDLQEAETVFPACWDVPLDHIVTETRHISRAAS